MSQIVQSKVVELGPPAQPFPGPRQLPDASERRGAVEYVGGEPPGTGKLLAPDLGEQLDRHGVQWQKMSAGLLYARRRLGCGVFRRRARLATRPSLTGLSPTPKAI